MNNNVKELSVFIDESIHEGLGFIMTAFVCSQSDINASVEKSLLRANFKPGTDEYKSGSYMIDNPSMQTLRDDLLMIARNESKIALLISSSHDRRLLGKDVLEALITIAKRNGLDLHASSVFFDQKIVNSEHEGFKIARQLGLPTDLKLHFEQDSKIIMGLQVADALAHISAQVLREQITGKQKSVHIGGENTGYQDGTTANLGWSLLMGISQCFFVRPMVYQESKESYDPAMNPVILTVNDDPATISQHPDLFGWGVITTADLDSQIRSTVESLFQKIWLGCIH